MAAGEGDETYMDTCRREHPVLHRLAHRRLWRYFARDYPSSRARFRAAARRRGLRLVRREVPNSFGLDLTVDIAVRPGTRGWVLHLAGTRGVDGYVGAAVQQVLLRHLRMLVPADIGLVLVHCVNPFGMAMGRLVNENNVDLEHNAMSDREFEARIRARRRWNPAYGKVDHIVNPTGGGGEPPGCGTSLSGALRSLWHWRLRGGPTTYEDIQDRGQHWRSDGLAFGGFELQASCRHVLDILGHPAVRPMLGLPAAVLASAVGASAHGEDTLWAPARHQAAAMRGTAQHPRVEVLPARRRNLLRRLARRLPRCAMAVHQVHSTQASRFRVLQHLRDENRQYHHRLHRDCVRYEMRAGGASAAAVDWERVVEASEDAEPSLHLGRRDHEPSAGLAQCLGRRRCDLRELFALGEEQWRERAALRGVLLVLQAAARVREVAAR